MKPRNREASVVLEVAGVSHEEESVYRLLVTSGRATTEDLARRAGLTDADAARIPDSLALKGLASHTDGTPRLFRAAPPDVALLPRLKRSADTLELARLEATHLIQAYQDTMRRHDAGQLLEVITGTEALRQHGDERSQGHAATSPISHLRRWANR